jgi:methyl-accepting chemotaxis protein
MLDAVKVGLSETNPDLDALSAASEEIRGFVLLVRKMARQSKLLALNAAMEAARAGEQGSGFAVVASEVRRLARSSQDGADRTEALVKEVLDRAARVREAVGAGEGAFTHVAEVARHVAGSLRDADRVLVDALLPTAERDDAVAATAPLAEAAAARVEQLAGDAGLLMTSVRESHLASGGQLARTQDLVAAAQTLTRVANQVASSTDGMRLDRIAPPAASPGEPGDATPNATPLGRLATS